MTQGSSTEWETSMTSSENPPGKAAELALYGHQEWDERTLKSATADQTPRKSVPLLVTIEG